MLIGSNGEKLGLLSIEDALSNAKAASMDLEKYHEMILK